MSLEQKKALLFSSLERTAEALGDIAPHTMALFYRRYPEALALFEELYPGARLSLDGEMVQQTRTDIFRGTFRYTAFIEPHESVSGTVPKLRMVQLIQVRMNGWLLSGNQLRSVSVAVEGGSPHHAAMAADDQLKLSARELPRAAYISSRRNEVID
jgi:hypothetical protein